MFYKKFKIKKFKEKLCTVLITSMLFASTSSMVFNNAQVTAYATISTDIQNSELLYESNLLEFHYNETRDLFTIVNKETGNIFKTGIDTPVSTEEVSDTAYVVETNLNSTFTGIANSLLSIEYFENSTIKRSSSAGDKNNTSKLTMTGKNTAEVEVNFSAIDINIVVELTFNDDGITYDIPFENITGEGKIYLASIMITPFLGASGGMEKYYNDEIDDYDDAVEKELKEGYIFVPDGSGSLISFEKNYTSFSEYTGYVYGENPAILTYNSVSTSQVVESNNPLFPVFGVAYTGEEQAFVARVDSGVEQLSIVARPKENMNIKYYWVYPRFEYNQTYYQVYNNKGEGYFKEMDELFNFDISITYSFLYGDEDKNTYSADYVGMARNYRDYLLEEGILTETTSENDDIPIRLDFIMNDSKNSIIGTQEVTVTDADDVKDILDNMIDKGITNINSGLVGWQSKGETLAEAGDYKFSRNSGTESKISNLVKEFSEKGIDISLSNDYSSINKKSSSYYSTAINHINGQYPLIDMSKSLPDNVPISEFSYAHPTLATKWLENIYKKSDSYSNSITVDGITNVLVSSYKSGVLAFSEEDTISEYKRQLSSMDTTLNLVTPNMYLWEYADRFLQAPVTDSSYIFQTEEVPFLQLVLNNTMEVYAPYSNFSFYSQSDILKMIDFNIYPSFMLSKEPSYLLQDTHSANLYSTESELYESLIENVYFEINDILRHTKDMEWVGRELVQKNVVVNSYLDGKGDKYSVVINYGNTTYTYNGERVNGLTAKLIKGGE